ncbi:hypothetical protein FRC11_010800 [Ceratobasidium sp. 423]|nr:hypothetical protein FRC11_010800 [Ceratobasidium sp. 423]
MYGGNALVGTCVLGLSGVLVRNVNHGIDWRYLWVSFQLLSAASQSAIDLATAVGSQASVPHNDLSTLAGFTESLIKLETMLSTRAWIMTHPIVLFVLAIGFAILCVVTSHFMPAHILGDEHNAAEPKDATLDDAEVTAEALEATAEITNTAIGFLPEE